MNRKASKPPRTQMKTAKPRKSKKPSPRRLYAGVQLAKALVGLCLGLAFVAAVGAPDIWEKVALAGLVAPLALVRQIQLREHQ